MTQGSKIAGIRHWNAVPVGARLRDMDLTPLLLPRRPAWFAVLAAAGFLGCGKPAPVPPGYTPLDSTNLASFPSAANGNKYPETLETKSGHDDSSGYDYADGEGYVD